MVNSERKPRVSQFLLLSATFLSAAASLFLGFVYFAFYWPFRGQFNAEGRYCDEIDLVVYHEQTGLLIVPTLAFLVLAILFVTIWWVRRRPALRGTVGGP
jgi:hypothetical protein